MLPISAGREAGSGGGAPPYVRHRPERTLLYQLVEKYYPALKAHLASEGWDLPAYVEQEFEDYLRCGRLEHGFLRVRCDGCHAEHLVAFSCKRIDRHPERQGLLVRDAENSHLAGDGHESGSMEQVQGSSITYRIAVGPQPQGVHATDAAGLRSIR